MKPQIDAVNALRDRPSIVFAPERVGLKARAQIQQGEIILQVGGERDWTTKFPTVVKALKKIKVEDAVLEGEIVWINEDGESDLQLLQRALKNRNSTGLIFYVKDLLEMNRKDLRNLSLSERRQKLERLLRPLQATAVLFDEPSLLLSSPSQNSKLAAADGLKWNFSSSPMSPISVSLTWVWIRIRHWVGYAW
jgi:hypothetical protein